MKSFRIIDTKFRILKGGKIGLAASIALIGGMLMLGSTAANAEDYFTGINSTNGSFILYNIGLDPLIDNQLTAETRSNATAGTNDNRGSTVIENVVFKPTSFVTSTYISAGSSITDASYTVASTSENLSLTLTFLNGANANDISKGDGTEYYTNGTTTFTNQPEDVAANLSTRQNNNYTANLVFNGGNTVYGNVDILNNSNGDNAGNIEIRGGASFAGTVDAGSIDIRTSSLVTFNDFVTLDNAVDSKLTFYNGGNVNLNNGLGGDIDFNGQNAKVTLGNGDIEYDKDVYTSVAGSGTFIFTTSSDSTVTGNIGKHNGVAKAIKEIIIDGTGDMGVDGSANTNLVTFNSAGTFQVNESLNTTKADNTIGKVIFNEVAGTLIVGGDLTANVSTVNNDQGTVIMDGSNVDEDTQIITGSLGTSDHVLNGFKIGQDSDTLSKTDIYATTTTLNYDGADSNAQLSMDTGTNLHSTVVTEKNELGKLNLIGGEQFVTGQVGAVGARLFSVNSGADGANSTFKSDVFAVTLNNTGTGTTNLEGNFTGETLNYEADGEVKLVTGKIIDAAVTTDTTDTGTLTFVKNGTMAAGKNIGTSTESLKLVNIGDIVGTQGTVTADTIYATTTAINNNGTLAIRANENIIGNVTTETTNTGTLDLTAGKTSVNGNIGTLAAALGIVKAGTDATTTYLNSDEDGDEDGDATATMSYINKLEYAGNGTVVLNGKNGGDAIGGMVGTVDFRENGTGKLQIGDGVNLTTGITGIQFANENDATMLFNGTSTVTGMLGNSTNKFAEIVAGKDSVVTFKDNVYATNFLLDQDATVNVNDGKSIIADSIEGIDGRGILNFLGSTTLHTDIGEDGSLVEVNFNTSSNNVTQTIDKNIYADTTTIGHTSSVGDSALSLADVTGKYDYAGATAMKEWRGQTAANITKNVTFGGDLVIADAKSAINFGTSQVSVDGDFITNHGGMSFTVNTKDISNDQSGIANSDGSAKVTVDGDLVMSGAEKIQINYVGSLKQAGTYDLITADGSTGTYAGTETNGLVSDNSFAIDTKVDLLDDSLVVSADRTSGGQNSANELYIQKSQTKGDLSNNAARALAAIAAAGSQTGDMVEVIQKMEIDSFGYGNSQANLETQVKKLAPIANASYSQAAIGANTLVNNTVSNRMADLRGGSTAGQTAGLSSGDEIARNGAWAKVIASTATQKQDGMYDGYKTNSGGLAAGIDHQFKNDITAGLALGYTSTNIDQQDFRSGDSADTKSYNIVAYAGKDFENAYVEGALSYAMHNTQGSRATAVGRTAQSDIDANQYTAHTSAGYRFNIQDSATVTPFLALDYTHLTQDAYTETGAGAINLNVSELSTSRTTVGGGVKLGSKIESGSTTLSPELKLATYHISGGNDTDIAAQYVGGGEKFVTPGNNLDNMMYNIGLGLKAQISDSTSLGFTVDYDRSSDGLFEGYTGQVFGRIAF